MDRIINTPNRHSRVPNNVPVGARNDRRQFVFFSHTTKGAYGRKVFIDAGLLPHFLSLVDPDSYDGKIITNHITQLRALAGGHESYQNSNNAFEHMELVKHVKICYRIYQDPPLNNNGMKYQEGVYVTDIRPAYSGDSNRFGLYDVKFFPNAPPNIKVSNSNTILNDVAAINGQDDGLGETAFSISRKYIGKDMWGGMMDFSLVYNPACLRNELGVWITPTQKSHHPELAAQQLANILMNTHNYRQAQGKQEKLCWHIIGDGSKLFQRALSKVTGYLDTQAFKFIDPTTDIAPVIHLLERKGAAFSRNTVITTNTDRSSSVALAATRQSIAAAIKKLGSDYVANANTLMKDTEQASIAFKSAQSLTHADQQTFMEIIDRARSLHQW